MTRKPTIYRQHFLIWSAYNSELIDYVSTGEGREDALREPTQWGIDDECVIELQRISREQYDALRDAEDGWRRLARTFA